LRPRWKEDRIGEKVRQTPVGARGGPEKIREKKLRAFSRKD